MHAVWLRVPAPAPLLPCPAAAALCGAPVITINIISLTLHDSFTDSAYSFPNPQLCSSSTKLTCEDEAVKATAPSRGRVGTQKRKENTTPFGSNLTRSLVIYQLLKMWAFITVGRVGIGGGMEGAGQGGVGWYRMGQGGAVTCSRSCSRGNLGCSSRLPQSALAGDAYLLHQHSIRT